MLGGLFLGLYFSSIISFSFTGHPVTYCVLLLMRALGISGYRFVVLGFSWYLVLFCLVYVGGVYVLFIFVSVHSPNQGSPSPGRYLLFFSLLLLLSFLFWGCSIVGRFVYERSHYLCSYFEGYSYILLCLVLMVGFLKIRVVVSGKDSFFR